MDESLKIPRNNKANDIPPEWKNMDVSAETNQPSAENHEVDITRTEYDDFSVHYLDKQLSKLSNPQIVVPPEEEREINAQIAAASGLLIAVKNETPEIDLTHPQSVIDYLTNGFNTKAAEALHGNNLEAAERNQRFAHAVETMANDFWQYVEKHSTSHPGE